MVSIIITTYKEKQTLPKAIQAILNQIQIDIEYEIVIVGPDEETENIVKNFQKSYPQIKYLKDKGVGKPAALNLAFKYVKGEILVLTDGDVWIGENGLKYLLRPFFEEEINVNNVRQNLQQLKSNKNRIGAVSGHPISLNPRNNLFGYWSHFLTEAAHRMRLTNQSWPCSGYFYAIRSGIVKEIPEEALSEDAVITEIIRDKGYQIAYAPEAKVYVKYPDNLRDWMKQKIRSVGGNIQKLRVTSYKLQARGFRQEISDGIKLFFVYPKNFKEFWWTILLYLARLYLWLLIFWEIKIKRKKNAEIWQRVESTK